MTGSITRKAPNRRAFRIGDKLYNELERLRKDLEQLAADNPAYAGFRVPNATELVRDVARIGIARMREQLGLDDEH